MIWLPIFLLKLWESVSPAVAESLIAEQRTQLITSSRMTHWERMLMSEGILITCWTLPTFFHSYWRRWHSPLLLRLTFTQIPHVDLSDGPFPNSEIILYTVGSSFIRRSSHHCGNLSIMIIIFHLLISELDNPTSYTIVLLNSQIWLDRRSWFIF